MNQFCPGANVLGMSATSFRNDFIVSPSNVLVAESVFGMKFRTSLK